jgi:hypothetical protein
VAGLRVITEVELQGRALISIESGADPVLLRTILESLRK